MTNPLARRRPLVALLAACLLGTGALASGWSPPAPEDPLAPAREGMQVLAPALQAASGVLPRLGEVLQALLAAPRTTSALDELFESALGSAAASAGVAAPALVGDPEVDHFDAEAEALLDL